MSNNSTKDALGKMGIQPTPPQPSAPAPANEEANPQSTLPQAQVPQPPSAVSQPSQIVMSDEALKQLILGVVQAMPQQQVVTPSQQPVIIGGTMNEIAITDPNDIIPEEEQPVYAARAVGWLSRSYQKNGITVPHPYNSVVKFEEAFTDITENGKNKITICTYTCKSKLIQEYLENHPEFGITFTRLSGNNFNDLINNEKYLQLRHLIGYTNKVKAMDSASRQQLALEFGINLADGSVDVVTELALRMYEADATSRQLLQQRRMESLYITHQK